MSGKVRNLRKRAHSDDEAGDAGADGAPSTATASAQEGQLPNLEHIKELQRQRKRGTGMDATVLAVGAPDKAAAQPEPEAGKHPWLLPQCWMIWFGA